MFPSWKSSKPSDAPVSSAFIQPSDYGFGQIVLPPETRRDPTPDEIDAARAEDRITGAEIMKGFGWTEDDFGRAGVYGMPTPVGQRTDLLGRRTNFWSKSQVSVWRERLLEFAATLGK